MATQQGCLDLLSALASLDPRVKFDGATAAGWAAVLNAVPDEVLVAAGMDAARDNAGGFMITVGMIQKHAEPYMRKIARDVKSAKVRGWIPPTWPDTQPIPMQAREKLTAEFDRTNNRPDAIAAAVNGGPDLGQIGRNIP